MTTGMQAGEARGGRAGATHVDQVDILLVNAPSTMGPTEDETVREEAEKDALREVHQALALDNKRRAAYVEVEASEELGGLLGGVLRLGRLEGGDGVVGGRGDRGDGVGGGHGDERGGGENERKGGEVVERQGWWSGCRDGGGLGPQVRWRRAKRGVEREGAGGGRGVAEEEGGER